MPEAGDRFVRWGVPQARAKPRKLGVNSAVPRDIILSYQLLKWLVRDAVSSEPVSALFSLLTGKLQGNFYILGQSRNWTGIFSPDYREV